MKIEKIIERIGNFKVSEETEDYEICEFFDNIRNELPESISLTKSQKEKLIKGLFGFLKNQNPEMGENFSFIHFIEDIDTPNYEIYNSELKRFNKGNGTITSILLLNRYINSLKGDEWKENLELMKTISENKTYSEYIREFALDFYESQIHRNSNNPQIPRKTIWSKIKSLWN
ncbi:hypothetical protein ACOSP6_14205 [Tenacibaculum sp. MEBiC06402]|uniref:hypothetical protein n=1 Tax=unclassified Tenacibaculum TaxID=2635139 RepID=UPI003B9ADE16